MKRLMLFVFSVMFVVGVSSAHAQSIDGWDVTNARLDGMGLQNWQTDDDFNIWSNPAFINTYNNRAYGEFGDYTNPADGPGPRMNNEITNQWGGANYKTSIGTFGLYLGREYKGRISEMDNDVIGKSLGPVALLGSAPSAKNPNNKFDLFYGTDLGDVALLGVRLNYSTYSDENTGPDIGPAASDPTSTTETKETTQSSSDINLTVGVALKALPVDVSLSLGLPSLSNKEKLYNKSLDTVTSVTTTTNQEDTLESDGAMNIGLLVRGKLLKTDSSVLLTTLRIASVDNSSKVKTRTETTTSDTSTNYHSSSIDSKSGKREDSSMGFGLDTAYNKKINDKNLFVGVIGLDYSSSTLSLVNTVNDDKFVDSAGTTTYGDPLGPINGQDIEQDISSISIPLRIAFENQTTKKISTRLGISKALYKSKTTKTTTKNYYEEAGTTAGQINSVVDYKTEEKTILSDDLPTSISLGATVKFTDSLILDATVNQDVLFTGTYLLSGIENTLFGKISLIYIF